MNTLFKRKSKKIYNEGRSVAPYSKTIKLLLTSGRASTEVKTGSPQKEEPPKWKK
jgi:hypothetical protein